MKSNHPHQRVIQLQVINTSNEVQGDIELLSPAKYFIERNVQSPPLLIGSKLPGVSIEEILYHLGVSPTISITGIQIKSNISGKELCKKFLFCAKSIVGDIAQVPIIVRESVDQAQTGIARIDLRDPVLYGKFSSFMIDILLPGEHLDIFFTVENVGWYHFS